MPSTRDIWSTYIILHIHSHNHSRSNSIQWQATHKARDAHGRDARGRRTCYGVDASNKCTKEATYMWMSAVCTELHMPPPAEHPLWGLSGDGPIWTRYPYHHVGSRGISDSIAECGVDVMLRRWHETTPRTSVLTSTCGVGPTRVTGRNWSGCQLRCKVSSGVNRCKAHSKEGPTQV